MDGVRPDEPGYDPRTIYIPPSAWKTFTPFETQFWEIKQHHYDTVLFFQKGKFFELYEEDAVRFSFSSFFSFLVLPPKDEVLIVDGERSHRPLVTASSTSSSPTVLR
jgi:Xaa-Pro aminopeptidase